MLMSCTSGESNKSKKNIENEKSRAVINLDGVSSDDATESDSNDIVVEAAIEDSYMVPLPEKPSDFSCEGVIYYNANPLEYQIKVPVNITFDEVKTEKRSEDGYNVKIITVHYMAKGIYSSECIDYSNIILPMTELCDIETGVIFTATPIEQKSGQKDGYAYSGSLNKGEDTVHIEYRCDSSYTEDDWAIESDGEYSKNIYFDVTYTVTAPETYADLGMKISPTTSYEEYLRMSEKKDYDTIEKYCPEGSRLLYF